jgi:hypothetical protein
LLNWDWDTQPEGPPRATTGDFVETELRIAVSDWDCRHAISYDSRLQQIDFDLQQQFVDRHRTELELLVYSLGG